MINAIYAGHGLQVSSGSLSLPYINMSASSAGMVRYNGTNMEVYDGSSWLNISTTANIILDRETEQLLNWCKEKKAKEQELHNLASEFPTVNDLIKQINEKQHQLDVVIELVKSHQSVPQ